MVVNGCIGLWNLDDPWTYPENLIPTVYMHIVVVYMVVC